MEDIKSITIGKYLENYSKNNNYTIKQLRQEIYQETGYWIKAGSLARWVKEKSVPLKENQRIIMRFLEKQLKTGEIYFYQYEEWDISNRLWEMLLSATQEFSYGGLIEVGRSPERQLLLLEYCYKVGMVGTFKTINKEGKIEEKLINCGRVKLLVGRSVRNKVLKTVGLSLKNRKKLQDFLIMDAKYGRELNQEVR